MNDLPDIPPSPPLSLRDKLDKTRRRLNDWWDLCPPNLRGSLLLISAFCAFGIMVTAIKALGSSIPLPQLLVIRQVIMTCLLLPLFLPDIGGALRTNHLSLQMLRGLCSLGSMLFGFTAIQHIPLADATAIGFGQILFVTVLAVFILKEKVGLHRWAATAVGFMGILIMVRPGQEGFDPYAIYAVIGAVFSSGIAITVRILSQKERTATILLYQAIVLFAALIVPTVLHWVWPTPQEWLLLLVVGVSGTAGQFFMTRGYQVGEATALAPLDFVRLIINTILGIIIFSELPDEATLAGAVLVVGSTIYTVRRNGKKGRKVPPPQPPGS
ncbi:hypothetical protein ATO6_18840 [Oceanicola sp. 22II-s10i]|uniref:DMT family transporter n=1 Tax=Oceanicola sp. 22II-s10i TaxID=1317116 RepID=UPI000B526462|nr:DMT family transporter [Oceanicola sp. 22II-s10i]OWU83487.1 hypothetical protein ATO6_18840 [Oceanicola sp. 22II-s10i]